MEDVTIVKLGGSVITIKDKPLTVDREALNRLCREIYESRKRRLIIVHGGGSFGHHLVHELDLLPPSRSANRVNLCKVVKGMDDLSSFVVEALISSGLPGVLFPTFAVSTSRSGRVKNLFLKSILMALGMGFVPVMRGDICCDEITGYSVVSGDSIVEYLAKKLGIERIIMCIDRDGIESEGKVLPTLRLRDRSYVNLLWKSEAVDVTGGMLHKLEALRPLAERGVRLLLINGRRDGRLFAALKGRRTLGTELRW
ncbi:MAG: isopentenyl phosphate kinase [Thermoproteota archaeon]